MPLPAPPGGPAIASLQPFEHQGRSVMSVLRTLVSFSLLTAVATGCGAAPAEVCGHIEQVVKKEAGDEAAKAAIDGCEFQWSMRNDTKGIFQYKELADCVMDANDIDALAKCK